MRDAAWESERQERIRKRRLKDLRDSAIIALVLVVMIGSGIAYGVWWWRNCANQPYYSAPMVCHMANTSSSSSHR